MALFNDKKKIFIQNLLDAGCLESNINDYIQMYENNEIEKLILFLKKYRKQLLENLHRAQYEIDCLDPLLRMLEKMDQ